MKNLGYVAVFVMLVLAVIAVIAVSSGLLVLLAYGVGKVVNLVLDFDPFQATLLSLAAIVVAGWLAVHILTSQVSSSTAFADSEDEADDDSDDDDDIADSGVRHYQAIPRWRQSAKQMEFLTAQPDDRCPCGSGRKFKNCHGAKTVR